MTSSAPAVVDTNIILRFLLNDHPQLSVRASAIFSRLRNGDDRAYVPEAVWAECVFLLTKTYRVPRTDVALTLSGLLSYRGIEAANPVVVRNAFAIFTEHPIAFVDALALCHAQALDGALITFDAKLDRLAKRLGKVGKSQPAAD